MNPLGRFMEPRSKLDRFLYALQAIFLPYTAFVVIKEGMEWAGIFLIVLWVIFSFYTVEWIIRKRP